MHKIKKQQRKVEERVRERWGEKGHDLTLPPNPRLGLTGTWESGPPQDSALTCYQLMNGTIMPYGPLLASGSDGTSSGSTCSVVVVVVVV